MAWVSVLPCDKERVCVRCASGWDSFLTSLSYLPLASESQERGTRSSLTFPPGTNDSYENRGDRC